MAKSEDQHETAVIRTSDQPAGPGAFIPALSSLASLRG